MISLSEYMKKTQYERQMHLNLNEDCIEIGGDSRNHRGLFAYFIGTDLNAPRINLCHACHNKKCSNVKHLYWGTTKENVQDSILNNTHENAYIRTVRKYGKENTVAKLRAAGKLGGLVGGGHNKLTQEVINSRLHDYYQETSVWGRNARLAIKWKCSHTQVKRFLKKYLPS